MAMWRAEISIYCIGLWDQTQVISLNSVNLLASPTLFNSKKELKQIIQRYFHIFIHSVTKIEMKQILLGVLYHLYRDLEFFCLVFIVCYHFV